jgi:DNA modification methylase
MMTKQRADLTFKDNLKRGRHSWLRLTPAYSVKIVEQILDENPHIQSVLDPFSGTGTTGLVASERGLKCDLWDINPLLVWLAKVKCDIYTPLQIAHIQQISQEIIIFANKVPINNLWFPPISNIARWWSNNYLIPLAKIFHAINHLCPIINKERNLLYIAFCQIMIQWSNASFNHQSMSFKKPTNQMRLFDESEETMIYQNFIEVVKEITTNANQALASQPTIYLQDARHPSNNNQVYDAVITSPPYVNRMSYIRELRPYMYWLGYLNEAKEAGELDWQAIGGTWGIATSRLNDWTPDNAVAIPNLQTIIQKIDISSPTLGHYVHKYFVDMSCHFANIYPLVANGGHIYYVIGNSKFYDTLVPAEKIYAELMQSHGFIDVNIQVIRKRNSKKELLEFLVSARKPA